MAKSWEEIAMGLIGGAETPEEVEKLMENSDFCAVLDQIAFQCSVCGWWCGIEEEASDDVGRDDFTCAECVEEL